MRAVVLRDGELVVAEVPEPPAPQPASCWSKSVACGICGSDLHTKSHTEQFLDANRAVGNLAQVFDPEPRRRHGPRVLVPRAGGRRRRRRAGARRRRHGLSRGHGGRRRRCAPSATRTTSRAATASGWCSTQPSACIFPTAPIPVAAALTEPFTVGEVSVRARADRARHRRRRARLRAGRARHRVGAAPARRPPDHRHRTHPAATFQGRAARRRHHPRSRPAIHGSMPIEATGSTQPPIVFNTTGRKGMLNQLLYESPWYTHIFEVSGLMEDDAITPIVAVTKQIRITFSSDGSLDALQTVLEAIAARRDRRRRDRHRPDRAGRCAGRLPGAGAPERSRQDPRVPGQS